MLIQTVDLKHDLSKIEELVNNAFSSTTDSKISDWFSFSEMSKSVTQDFGIALKAVENNEIIGFIHAQAENVINGREGTEKWSITNLAVNCLHTGKGIGSKLLIELLQVLNKRKIIKVFVHTNIDDERVIHFYKKNGFEDAGIIKDYYYSGSAIFLIKYVTK